MVDQDLKNMSEKELQEEVMKLRIAIRAHRDQKGDDNCWQDDGIYLYGLLPEKKDANPQLPDKQLMMQNCMKYYECRKRGKLYRPFVEMPKYPTFAIDWLNMKDHCPYYRWPIVCTDGDQVFIGCNDSPIPNDIRIAPERINTDIDAKFWFPLPVFPKG